MTRQQTAFTIVATLFLTSILTTTPNADVLFNQEFKYFKVSGKTSQQIFQDFQKQSPIKAKGKYDATLGVAAIKLIPEVELETREKRCHIANARVTADVVIHLPEWVNYKNAGNAAKLGWDILFEDIKKHELEHANIAREYAARIEKKMLKQRARANCEALEASLKQVSSNLIVRHDSAQRRFDRKEYKRLFGR